MRVFLLALLLPLFSFGQQKFVLFDIEAGYLKQTATSNVKTGSVTQTKDLSKYPGWSIGSSIFLSGDDGLGLKIGLNYQKYDLLTKYDIIQITPALSMLPPIKSKINILANIGFPISIPIQDGYKTYISTEIKVGLGYRGIIATAAYQYGLSAMAGTDQLNDTRMKSKTLVLGLALFPQLIIKK